MAGGQTRAHAGLQLSQENTPSHQQRAAHLVECVLLVGRGVDYGVVLSTHVGLDAFAVLASTLIDVLALGRCHEGHKSQWAHTTGNRRVTRMHRQTHTTLSDPTKEMARIAGWSHTKSTALLRP